MKKRIVIVANDDVVKSTLSEIILFFLFFFLILLGDYAETDPGNKLPAKSLGVTCENNLQSCIGKKKKIAQDVKDCKRSLQVGEEKLKKFVVSLEACKGDLQDGEKNNNKTTRDLKICKEGLQDSKKNNDKTVGDLKICKESLQGSKKSNDKITRDLEACKEGLKECHAVVEKNIDWPRTLNLPDNNGYRFGSGESIPSKLFLKTFRNKAEPQIHNVLFKYGDSIVAIEVIGHTDEEVIKEKEENQSTLDNDLIDFLDNNGYYRESSGDFFWINLSVSDNAGLGLARAAAVATLIKISISKEYPHVKILPYSAGQLIENSDTYKVATGGLENFPNRSRRRVEIRFVTRKK